MNPPVVCCMYIQYSLFNRRSTKFYKTLRIIVMQIHVNPFYVWLRNPYCVFLQLVVPLTLIATRQGHWLGFFTKGVVMKIMSEKRIAQAQVRFGFLGQITIRSQFGGLWSIG